MKPVLGLRPRLLRVAALGAWCICWLWSCHGSAATVAIVGSGSSPATSEVAFRLRGELAALRFEVVLLQRPVLGEVDTKAWLEQTAEARGIDAALEVIGEPTTQAVDVWIFQHAPRRAQVTQVVVEPGTSDRAGTLAIRAIEVLRSNDVEAELAKQSPREATAKASSPVIPQGDKRAEPSRATARTERLGVELGAGLLGGLDGVGLALLPVLRVDFRLHRRWALHGTLSGLGTKPTLRAAEGTVRVAQSYAALGICYCPSLSSAVAPYFSLASGVTRTALEGSAVAPARGHSVARWSLLVDAGAGARLALPGGYHATLSGHVQMAQPHVTIRVLDERMGSTGRPSLLANLMVGTWL